MPQPLRDVDDLDTWLMSFVGGPTRRGPAAVAAALRLADALGRPDRHAPAVHVVGTAGKGTVATLVTGRLVAAGVPTATHLSPHVHDLRERFLLDGARPPWPIVLAAADRVARAVDDIHDRGDDPPSYFAVTTMLSWLLGRDADVELFVTEAGVGGRWDATNLLDRPDTVTVVTAIGLDHADVLGGDLAHGASEKLAVLAGRRRAVLGPQPSPEVVDLALEAAARFGVELHRVDGDPREWREAAAATADTTVALLAEGREASIPSTDVALPPGRYEVIRSAGRRVVLDGAHNPMKLDALVATVAGDVAPVGVIAAVGKGKDLAGCATRIAALGVPVFVTEFGADAGRRSHRAATVAAAIAACGGRAEVWPAPAAAVERAWRSSRPGDTILVTGSFLHLAAVAAAFTVLEPGPDPLRRSSSVASGRSRPPD